MASDNVAVAIKKKAFDGGSEIVDERRRIGQAGSRSLPQILRNFVAQLSERTQSGGNGATKIANGAASATIVLPTAMPDASYDVQVTLRTDPAGKAVGGAVLSVFVSAQTASQFTVTASPAGNVTADVLFTWTARHRTQLNTKG